MARIRITDTHVIVDLTPAERLGSLYFRAAPRGALRDVVSVSVVPRPSRDLVDDAVTVPVLLHGLAFRPRSTIPFAKVPGGRRACVVTWRKTPAVRVDFDRERSPWAMFLVSDRRAQRVVEQIAWRRSGSGER